MIAIKYGKLLYYSVISVPHISKYQLTYRSGADLPREVVSRGLNEYTREGGKEGGAMEGEGGGRGVIKMYPIAPRNAQNMIRW